MKDSEAYLLGQPEQGVYLILEVLNLSRVANCVGSVGLAQRAVADALTFAQRRVAFGKPILEHPSDRYRLFRLVAHLAKYWTAELAVQTAKWAMEVHGAMGVLAEYRVERWLREAMILPIWEGTPHRQILDGLEAMERKKAHHLLFHHLATSAEAQALEEMAGRVEELLAPPTANKEVEAEAVFRDLAEFTAKHSLMARWLLQ